MIELQKPVAGGEPVFMQIVRQFKLLILRGRIKHGEEIPSRRMLAMKIGVNPMTVQKAFAELEEMGLIHTPPNSKSVVQADEHTLAWLRVELLEREVLNLVETAIAVGVTYEELAMMLKKGYRHA